MKSTRLIILILLSTLWVAVSCSHEEWGPATEDASDNLERVPVTLQLSVDELVNGTPETKTTQEPDVSGVTSDSQIKNFVVLQFDGIDSDAPVMGGQAYFDHWPLNPASDPNDKLTLVASDHPNTVVVLANTFRRVSITSSTTLGSFLEQGYTTINDLSGVFTTADGDDYLRLSGSLKMDNVTAGSSVAVSLKRNVAKVIVNVKNNTKTANPQVQISKVQLRDVNGKYYYMAHVGSGISASFTDPYSDAIPCRFNHEQQDFPAANNPGGASEGDVYTYTYYVPANLRGTTTNSYQYNKGNDAPAGATRFCLYCTYGASATPINYTYYLGENLTNDFNLQPNYKYTYNITINSKGDSHYDYRIEDLGEVVFETDANCYMVQPPSASGQTRIYAIPVRRAAVFWNEPGVNLGVYGASTMANYGAGYTWDSGTNWTAEVLWSDFDLSPYTGDNSFLVSAFSSGRGFDPSSTAATNQPYFKVRISAGMKGNVVVGVKVNNIIMWSWHIWITDYDPNIYVTPVDGKYIYTVKNGSLHRYKDSPSAANKVWSKAPTTNEVGYANGFIMDRNLGARTNGSNRWTDFGLFYQFGRKDPFVMSSAGGSGQFYLGGTDLTFVLNSEADDPAQRRIINDNATYLSADSYKNIRFSVTHPRVFIAYSSGSNGNWTTNDDDLGDGGITSYKWNDRKIWTHTGDQALLELKKSIYDPCPAGWKVPTRGTWSGFNKENAGNTETQTFTTKWENDIFYYYPEGYVNASTTGAILYANTGRLNNTGSSTGSTTNGYYYHDSASSSNQAYRFMFTISELYPEYSNYTKTYGFAIRCVRE